MKKRQIDLSISVDGIKVSLLKSKQVIDCQSLSQSIIFSFRKIHLLMKIDLFFFNIQSIGKILQSNAMKQEIPWIFLVYSTSHTTVKI